MKGKLTAIIAGTMLAVTGATLPASALVSSRVSQQPVNGQSETLVAKLQVDPYFHKTPWIILLTPFLLIV